MYAVENDNVQPPPHCAADDTALIIVLFFLPRTFPYEKEARVVKKSFPP